jgi:hypothetical protein
MLQSFLAGLTATLLQAAESIGGALIAAWGQIALQFSSDERGILIKVKQKWIDTYNAEKAKGTDEINAIENASTAAYNEFCADETDEFNKVKAGVIASVEYAAKSAGGVLKSAVGA